MRSIFLALMLMVSGVAWAGVTGEVVGQAMDENGNIVVKVAYEMDGVPVTSPYPLENGRPIFVIVTILAALIPHARGSCCLYEHRGDDARADRRLY